MLIFLDAHCEATESWIEPLLARIEEDHTAVLVPIIDVIEANTLGYSTNGDSSYQVGLYLPPNFKQNCSYNRKTSPRDPILFFIDSSNIFEVKPSLTF